ncbi:hypothetical protein ACEWY4_016232 [Coilia grayii]|uniref:UDP-glucuronosyltransferase n=1 Tax=Coilia grayii TaxID=363190 RepID=A0ABD1JJZ3_9TELE
MMAKLLLRGLMSYPLLLSLLISCPPECHGGKILVMPIEGSRWVNTVLLIRELHARGHTVTVMRSADSWFMEEESPYYNSITVQHTKALFSKEFLTAFIGTLIEVEKGSASLLNFTPLQFISTLQNIHAVTCQVVSAMFEDRALMQRLNESQFDVLLTDPVLGHGILLAHYLKVPLVYNVRWALGADGHLFLAPSPTSYVPMLGSHLSDQMTFLQRVKNTLLHLMSQFRRRFILGPLYQAVCDRYFEPKVDFYELVQAADIWLMRVDFVFEFPRPTMPNVVYVGGFQCKPAEPLPQDLEDFVQSSGEHGVIVMSLGTFVGDVPRDFAESVAAAFAELPQKVIWKHAGERPSSLGNNTLLVKWMPQKDLLGHPKTRAFVAHGGTNGVQEAIYHGVPVVGIPLFHDQYDNLLRLKEKGGARILSVATVDKANVLQALRAVLHETSYREKMQRLSRLHRDQPMTPMDRAIFWIEFVMRHKGAAHLRTESYKMPWYSYHSLDVAVFLLAVIFGFMGTVFYTIRLFCCKVCFRKKIKYD